jgi:hypothetical protein
MTKQQRLYWFAGSSLVDLRSNVGWPFLYLRTVAFWNPKVSRSKLKAGAAAPCAINDAQRIAARQQRAVILNEVKDLTQAGWSR